VDAFTSADIPFKKCNNKNGRTFYVIGFNIPSEATARNFYSEIMQKKLKNLRVVFEKQVFIIIDESEIQRSKYINV
jgi:hypothetical protein